MSNGVIVIMKLICSRKISVYEWYHLQKDVKVKFSVRRTILYGGWMSFVVIVINLWYCTEQCENTRLRDSLALSALRLIEILSS